MKLNVKYDKITSVMQDELNINLLKDELHPTKQKLIEAGKKEFFHKGYMRASLRKICTMCKVTTGAFYFFFPNKEALFCNIVDPVIAEWKILIDKLLEKEKNDPASAMDNDKRIMEFEMQNREEILILLEKSEGSCYENFKHEMVNGMEQQFMEYFELFIGHQPNSKAMRMLVNLRIETNISILKGASSMEDALYLNEIMAFYADGGFQNLIKNLKDKL